MSRTYVTKSGDTLAGIATIYYGNAGQSSIIAAANPKITNPLIMPVGIVLTIPDIPGVTDTKIAPSAPIVGGDKDEISLTIDGTQFVLWESVSINRSMDKIGDTFNFSVPFDSKNKDLIEIFKPFGYKKVAVNVAGKKIITGIALQQNHESSPNARIISISGYSLPGILADCNYKGPLEFKNTDLQQITNTLIQPYSLTATFLADKGAAFKKVAIGAEEKIADFLTKLAQQRGLILSSNEEGELIFQKATSEGAVLALEDGKYPVIGIRASYDGAIRFSSMTGFLDGWEEGKGQKAVVNDNTIGITRLSNTQLRDIAPGDIQNAVTARLGRSIATATTIGVDITGIRDKEGKLLKDNTKVTLKAPDVYIKKETEFIIREVTYNKTVDSLTSGLSIIFPEVFSGEIRKSYPWD